MPPTSIPSQTIIGKLVGAIAFKNLLGASIYCLHGAKVLAWGAPTVWPWNPPLPPTAVSVQSGNQESPATLAGASIFLPFLPVSFCPFCPWCHMLSILFCRPISTAYAYICTAYVCICRHMLSICLQHMRSICLPIIWDRLVSCSPLGCWNLNHCLPPLSSEIYAHTYHASHRCNGAMSSLG